MHRDSMINEAGELQEAINQYLPPFILSFKVDTPIQALVSRLILKMMEKHSRANTAVSLNPNRWTAVHRLRRWNTAGAGELNR